jgi:hypothetical protein
MPKLNLQRIKDILAKKQLSEMEEDMMEEDENEDEMDDDKLKNVMSKKYTGKDPQKKKDFDNAKMKVALMIHKKTHK